MVPPVRINHPGPARQTADEQQPFASQTHFLRLVLTVTDPDPS